MSEHDEQVAFIEWTELQKNIYPHVDRFFAVLNQNILLSKLSNRQRNAVLQYSKSEGMKKGVSDLMLLVPRGIYHGLIIEMKYGKNKTTQSQGDWLDFFSSQGFCTCVCYGCDEAILATKDYYRLEKK